MHRSLRFRLPALFLAGILLAGLVSTGIAIRLFQGYARDQALPYWLDHYNRQRPHSSLGGRPPISRVHNLCGQDT